jgi:hypothetical protein
MVDMVAKSVSWGSKWTISGKNKKHNVTTERTFKWFKIGNLVNVVIWISHVLTATPGMSVSRVRAD